MARVALDALEGFLDVVMRAFQHLRKAFAIEHECAGNMTGRIPLPGNSQDLLDFLMDVLRTTGNCIAA
jgi:hypothetical protein